MYALHNKVEAFNWPMNEEKDKMLDPSNVGGHKILLGYLKLIESGQAGFRPMTKADWDAWKEARDQSEVVIPTKRARAKRLRPVTRADEQGADEQPTGKKARKGTRQTRTKSKGKAKAKDTGPVSEQATEASSTDVPISETEGESDYLSENGIGPHMSSPPPSAVPLPTVSDVRVRPNWADTMPTSPPLPAELTITINRRPSTPPTPSTVPTSPSSPTFRLYPVLAQAPYNSDSSNTSQSSPRGRRSYHNGWDCPFINHTPDSMSSGRPASRSSSPASRSNSPALRSNNPTSRIHSLDKSCSSATISPLAPLPVGISLPSSSLNHTPSAHDFYTLPTLHAATPPPFGLGSSSSNDWLGANGLGDQSPLLPGEWDFGGPHTALLGGVPEPPSSTLVLPMPEFASPDA